MCSITRVWHPGRLPPCASNVGWLIFAIAAVLGLGLMIGAIASRKQMSAAVVVVLCIVGVGFLLMGALLALGIGLL